MSKVPQNNNPRSHSNEDPFIDELGVEKEGYEDPKSFKEQGWFPMSARDARPTKIALFDNMEVPGSAYMGRDRAESPGEMGGGMGNPYSRNTDNQRNWNRVERVPSIETPTFRKRNPQFDDGNEDGDIDDIIDGSSDQKTITGNKENKMDFKKVAAKSKARLDKVYAIEDDYAAYGRYCGEPTCVGVWKELLGFDEKRALKIERQSEVWRCPKCGKITEAIGSVSEQTSGPAAYNTYNSGQPAAEEDGFEPVNSIKPDRDRTRR